MGAVNTPVEWDPGIMTYEKFRAAIGRSVPDSWIEAQVASGMLAAATVAEGEPPALTGASVTRFIADRAPGGEHYVGPRPKQR